MTDDIEIRTPTPDEWRACRNMLPEAFADGVLPQLLVAAGTKPFRFLGACASEPRSFEGQPAWHLHLHVVRPFRRQGIGTRLMETFVDRRVGPAVRRLITSHASAEPGGAHFLRSLGFDFAFRSSRYEVDLAPYITEGQQLRERLVAHGRVPPGARTVRLSDAPRDKVMHLLAERDGTLGEALGPSWSEALKRRSVRELSTALMLDEDAVGLVLADVDGSRGEMLWRVVANGYRGGWANVVVSTASGEQLYSAGARTLRFSTTSDTPDTDRAVRLYGAERAVTHSDYFARTL